MLQRPPKRFSKHNDRASVESNELNDSTRDLYQQTWACNTGLELPALAFGHIQVALQDRDLHV